MFSYHTKKNNHELLDKEERAYYFIEEQLENVIINFDKEETIKKKDEEDIVISKHSMEKIFNLQNLEITSLAPHLLFIFEYTETEVHHKKVVNYNISFDSVLKVLKNFYVLPDGKIDDEENFITMDINSILKIFAMSGIDGDPRIEYCDMSISQEEKTMKENLVKIFVIKKEDEKENYSKKLKRIKLLNFLK